MVETHCMRLQSGQLSHFLLLATNLRRPPVEREKTDRGTRYIRVCVYVYIIYICIHLSKPIPIHVLIIIIALQ